jgi:hypothetical protein
LGRNPRGVTGSIQLLNLKKKGHIAHFDGFFHHLGGWRLMERQPGRHPDEKGIPAN